MAHSLALGSGEDAADSLQATVLPAISVPGHSHYYDVIEQEKEQEKVKCIRAEQVPLFQIDEFNRICYHLSALFLRYNVIGVYINISEYLLL